MMNINDSTTIQGIAKFKIRELKDGEEITHISPGSYEVTNDEGKDIFVFDWFDSISNYYKKDNTIVCETYSLDNEIIEDSIKENNSGIENMERYDLNFFKKYVKFEDLKTTCLLVDINEEEVTNEFLEVEFISLELIDPITEESIIYKK